jgi:hypothetical protein
MSLIIRPLTILVEKPEPVGPTIHHYPLITAGNEYGWQLPIDVLLNAETNGLIINISFNTNVSDSSNWEGGFYVVQDNGTSNPYIRWVGMGDIRPEVVSPGYRECNVTNAMIVNGLTTSNINRLNDWKNNGYTTVFTHPAAFNPNKFIGEPNADFIFED